MEIVKVRALSDIEREERQALLNRSGAKMAETLEVIRPIIDRVASEGDSAVVEFTEEFDKTSIKPSEFFVPKDRIQRALDSVDPELRSALETAHGNIRRFHQDQKEKISASWAEVYKLPPSPGTWACGAMPTPVDRAAGYVPGGTAAYPSTVLMASVPALTAGVERFVLTTPPREQGKVPDAVLAAAGIAGVENVLRIGGVQAVAALAFGTETIPRVDVVVGPGNIYVTAAKAWLSALGVIGIDFPAGPSEVVIIADASADPEVVAMEMIAQAEHDTDAASILVTNSRRLATETQNGLSRLVPECQRHEIVRRSLEEYGAIIVCDSLEQAVEFSNEYAPEHLQLSVENEEETLSKVRNAGSIFVGPCSPVAIGDYVSGTNHILPTGGAARFTSGDSVGTFMKYPTVQKVTREGLQALCPTLSTLSRAEGFFSGHGRSAEIRLEKGVGEEEDLSRFVELIRTRR